MKLITKRLTLLVLFAVSLLNGFKAIAQELQEIFVSSEWVVAMKYINDDTFWVLMTESEPQSGTQEIRLGMMNEQGEILDTELLWTNDSEGEKVWNSELFAFHDNQWYLYFITVSDSIANLHYVTVSLTDDLNEISLEITRFDWDGTDYWQEGNFFVLNSTNVILNKDGSTILSYPPYPEFHVNGSETMKLLKFDTEGNLLIERRMEDFPADTDNNMFATPDSLGCRIILRNTIPNPVKFCCHTLDSELNTLSVKDVDALSWPLLCSFGAYFCYNPITLKTYSINTFSYPAVNNNPAIESDILMGCWDADFNQVGYSWGIHTPSTDFGGTKGTIDFDSEGGVYMLAGMDEGGSIGFFPRNLYIVYMDENLNKYGEVYYQSHCNTMLPNCIRSCPTGGAIISAFRSLGSEGECCLFKIKKETIVGIEEAHEAGFAVAIAYPNPGGSTLNIRTGLQKARVEVYDALGRKVHRQEITENITAIDAESWPSGVYVWKVYANGSEAESGKWVKE